MKSDENQLDKNYETLDLILLKLNLEFPVAEISRKTGYAEPTISQYLNKKVKPSSKFLQSLLTAFDIKIDDALVLDSKTIVKKEEKSYFSNDMVDELFRSEYFKGRLATFISERLNKDNDNVQKYRSELKDLLKIIKKEKV